MSLSPEWQLVLSCSRAALLGSENEASLRELLDRRLDWRRAAAIACQNRIGPLVHSTLRRFPLPPAAQPALELLKTAYVATAARNAVLFGALEAVLEAFSAGRTPVLALKGAALAGSVYRERALRPMADIDLLVREQDLAKAEQQLRTIGYEVAHDPQTKEELKKRHHHWVFRSDRPGAGGIPIELHWKLDPPGGPVDWDVRGIWERAALASIAGRQVRVLSPEDLVLHLGLHLCRHRFNGGVIPLCDITAAIRHYGDRIDWATIQARALELDGAEFVSVPLHLAAELTGARVPVEVLTASGPPGGSDRMLQLARERILEEKGDVRGAAAFRLRWRRRSLGARVGAAQRALSPPRFSYLTHLAGLLRRYTPWLWALARHPGRVSEVIQREESKSILDSWYSAGGSSVDPH